MQQFISTWSSFDRRRQIIILAASMAMFAAIFGLVRVALQPNMKLLYAGLEGGAAGEVVRALEQRGVLFEVRGGSIFVDAPNRDELRMTLASEGLPSSSSQGYELLDNLSGFGTTSQMFDAAYWRAKEGELARTIVSSPFISFARVHIANANPNPFRRDVRSSASISVIPAAGGISSAQARALKHLVASAVTGLSPEDVSVIDGDGALISGSNEDTRGQSIDDKAQLISQRVLNLLEARVGSGNAVVEVSVDTFTETESIREKRFDPESRVAISTETEERTNNSKGSGGGDVTVASNLPNRDEAGGNSSSQNSETRERVNYEVSETEREVHRAPGATKRITVAVLVNEKTQKNSDGILEFESRSEDELEALRELVASAVGYDENRGDIITLKSMQFERGSPAGTAAVGSFPELAGLDIMSIVQLVVLSAVALVLGLFVVRPLFLSAPVQTAPMLAAPDIDDDEIALPDSRQSSVGQPLTGEIDEGPFDSTDLSVVSDGTSATKILDEQVGDPVERLRNLIGERQEETVEILRSWLEEREENA